MIARTASATSGTRPMEINAAIPAPIILTVAMKAFDRGTKVGTRADRTSFMASPSKALSVGVGD